MIGDGAMIAVVGIRKAVDETNRVDIAAGRDHWQTSARKAGLTTFFVDNQNEDVDSALLVGRQVGSVAVAGLAHTSMAEEDVMALVAEVTGRLADVGLTEPVGLHLQLATAEPFPLEGPMSATAPPLVRRAALWLDRQLDKQQQRQLDRLVERFAKDYRDGEPDGR